jgi:hypothetical protein
VWHSTSRTRGSCAASCGSFHVEREQIRISYFIAPSRRIVLLTVFRKTRQREQAEIDRAWRAMQVCMCEHLREEAQ